MWKKYIKNHETLRTSIWGNLYIKFWKPEWLWDAIYGPPWEGIREYSHTATDHSSHFLQCQEKNTTQDNHQPETGSPASAFARLLAQTPEEIMRKVVLAPIEMWADAQTRGIESKRLISCLPKLKSQTF